MIHFEVIDSPDILLLGTQKFQLHHVQFGRSLKNTVIIDDPKVYKTHAMLRLNNKGLIVESPYSFLVNEKKVEGTIVLSKNDLIQFGETKIKIIDYDNSVILDSNSYYNFLTELEIKEPTLHTLISAIEEEFVTLTSKESNVLEE